MTPKFIATVVVLLATTSWAHRPEADEHLHLQARDTSGYSVHAGGHFVKDHKHDHQAHAHHKSHKHHASHKTVNLLQTQELERPAPEVTRELGRQQQERLEKGALGGVKAGLNEAGVKKTDQNEDYPVLGLATCGKEVEGGHDCPADCAYAAESEAHQCHFKCVAATSCGTQGTNRNNTIPDEKMKLCRHCDVEGCLTCETGKPGEDKEFCVKCMPGYYAVDKDGDGLTEECRSWTIYIFVSIAVGAAIGMLCGLLWFCELQGRAVVNEEGLTYGMECRARSKVRQPENTLASEHEGDGIGPRLLYPFQTNLCTTNIAGPGNMLFFRFQAATLIWAISLTAVWSGMVLYIDPNLFSLGLKKAATPQQMCYVVMMGRRLQLKFLWVKVYWLVFAYLFSFIGAVVYAVNSMRLFQHLDNEHTTMADFVAICRSVPKMKGDEKPEELIKECIEKETGEKVVGVSVCWNFHGKKKEVTEALEQDVGSLEHAGAMNNKRFSHRPSLGNAEPGMDHEAEAEPGCVTSIMDKINNSTLEKWHCHFHEHGEEKSEEEKANEITEMLKGLETTELAFVVFETEDARDKAVQAGGASGPRLIPMPTTEKPDGGFFLEEEKHEPESCCWEHFNIHESEIAVNVGKGVLWMTVSLVAWTGLLYMPYAHYMGSFSFANGDEPGEMSEGIFVGLVVAAQIGLFVVASMASHNAGFSFEDDKQRIYIVLYNSALIVNLILDMSLTAYLAYHQMCGRGVRVSDGRLLADIPTLQEIIESYPMQKAIGNNLFKYCWPATFFIPFFAEPFAAQVGPYLVGKFMVRSNKKMKGENAEKALELSEAEQGRYADVMFNAILVSAVPFIAPGYILKTFSALILSHLYIYCYDHWRVLRCCTRFWFASDTVSVFSQKIFAVPCGILLSSLVFKGNQFIGARTSSSLGAGPLTGTALWGTMAAALFGHIFIHWLVLDYVVPMFPGPDNVNAVETYDVCAKSTPCTWFSSNPVHCLRSKYVFKHDPPQAFYVLGKEHLQKENAAIGSYYTTDEDLKQKETFKLDEGL